jgi:serine/threonine protein kinase
MRPGTEIGFYTLKSEIARGGFGSIWLVRGADDPELYAMKLEPASAKRQTLRFEIGVLKRLQGNDKFPTFIADGQDQGYVYCVMELCGPSLDRVLRSIPSQRFSREYLPTLTVELLGILEQFHAKGYVHRDIKPGNFVTRITGTAPLALLDFGVSKIYMDLHSGAMLEQKEFAPAIGSQLYSSPNAQQHMDLGRRDDLYSLMYSILDMAGFMLPWKGQTFEMDVVRAKTDNSLERLLGPIGPGFAEMGRYIESMEFGTAPNYALLKTLAIRDQLPPPVMFQWMVIRPREAKCAAIAAKIRAPFDPTGMLIEMCPWIIEEQKGLCLLL